MGRNGNLFSYTDMVIGTWNFSYDHLNRLMAGIPSDGSGQYLCFDYDSFGNRTQADFQDTACRPNPIPLVGASGYDPDTATYNAANHVTWTTVNGAVNGFAYDAAGDVTFDGNNYYAYDGEGQLCAVQTDPSSGPVVAYGYLYDAEGRRVAKGTITVTSTPLASSVCNPASNGFTLTESYVLGQGGEQLTNLSWSGTTSTWQRTDVYGAGTLLATYDTAGLHFHLTDPLGTRRVQANSSGEPELDCQSLPFGDQLDCYPDPAVAASGDNSTPLHFTGKERDQESGNDYFGARYYGSNMGRFLSPDPYNAILIKQGMQAGGLPAEAADSFFSGFLENPQNLNEYTYGLNNPLRFTDPTGASPTDDGHHLISNRETITQVGTLARDFVDSVKTGELSGNGKPNQPGFNEAHRAYNDAVKALLNETEEVEGPSSGWSLAQWKDFANGVLNSNNSAIKSFLDDLEDNNPGAKAALAASISAYRVSASVIARAVAAGVAAQLKAVFGDFLVCVTCDLAGKEKVTWRLVNPPS
jgi:RHS repeat-associated protein